MRVRFIENYGRIMKGSTPKIDDNIGKILVHQGYCVEITEPQKSIELPVKDKMVKRPTKAKQKRIS